MRQALIKELSYLDTIQLWNPWIRDFCYVIKKWKIIATKKKSTKRLKVSQYFSLYIYIYISQLLKKLN